MTLALNVSRGCMREALLILEQCHPIAIVAHRGVCVTHQCAAARRSRKQVLSVWVAA